MMATKRSNYKEIYELLDHLCKAVTGSEQKDTLKKVAQFLSNHTNGLGSTFVCDEAAIVSKICQHLLSAEGAAGSYDVRSSTTAASTDSIKRFLKLHETLKVNYPEESTRAAFLMFLYGLAGTNDESRINSGPVYSAINKSSKLMTLTANSHTKYLQPSDSALSKMKDDTTYKASPRSVQCLELSQESQRDSSPAAVKKINEEVLQNAINVCTGIEGNYLRKDIITGEFKLGNAKVLDIGQAHMLLRLSKLGYHYGLLKAYTDPNHGLCPLGLMGQGFVQALKIELTQYIGSVALLQDELNHQREADVQNRPISKHERLTLMKIVVWASPVLERLQWLTVIAKACVEKKGGELATAVYNFMQGGNLKFNSAARELLLALCNPLYQMLSRWLLEGEINDPHNEFFIECIAEVGPDRLWHDKYRLRPSMLPVFISIEMANKILVAGKSINFLCEVCEDKQPVKGGNELQACIDKYAEDIFSYVADTKLHATIDSIYLNTSKRVLDIVMGPHKLLEHLQAMRRYLLLGQGDFIGILMENLKTELDKPAKELYSYDLSSIMDAAIRSTNAQYEDPEILNHLDVHLMAPCEGDTGWDILTLQYTVSGPLAPMLSSMGIYQVLFKPLWRMKHMEFVLSSKIWKEQMCNEKTLRPLKKELHSVLYQLHLITSEMIHFINQMQYYILFEVIECSWVELQERVHQAKALDDILTAHDDFLNAIKRGVFLDPDSIELFNNLEDVYNGIVRLEIWQDRFFDICFKEVNARRECEMKIMNSEKEGKFGLTAGDQLQRDQDLKIFHHQLSSYQKSLTTIGNSYEKAVRCFLLSLNSNNDLNLQLFGIRLDFNEYYKKRDQRLGVPLTFEHMRLSNVFFNKSFIGSRHSSFN